MSLSEKRNIFDEDNPKCKSFYYEEDIKEFIKELKDLVLRVGITPKFNEQIDKMVGEDLI